MNSVLSLDNALDYSLFVAVSTQDILDVCSWLLVVRLLLIFSLFRKQFSEAVGVFIVSGHESSQSMRQDTAAVFGAGSG